MDLEHFTDLDEHLAVGSYPHTPDHVEFLRDNAGIGAVLNLQSDLDLRTRGIDWTIMWPLYTRMGLQTIRVPILLLVLVAPTAHQERCSRALVSLKLSPI